jgi:cysteine desulfurase/selenocysteine lyase
MNDVTPELIAAIASRLLNEIPGANSIPKTDVEMPPSTPAMPSWPTDGFALLPASEASMPAAPEMTAGTAEIPSSPAPVSAAEGARAFLERIRATGTPSGNGLCTEDPDQAAIRRLFASPSSVTMGPRPMDVSAIRRDFPILHQRVHGKPLVWLDNAATTQKPQSAIDAVSRYYASDNSNIHRGAHTLAARATDAFEQARQKVRTFLGAASPKEIVFVRGTTEGINLVAQTFGRAFFQPGDEIVLSTLEHHSNIVPWQMIAREKGAVIRVIPVTDRGEIMLEEYQRILGPRTRLVALSHASNSVGTILPIVEMTQMAKRHNARVLIDGAQSVAHLPIDVQQIGCDYFVFSGHKIFAPTGIGVVYAKEELLEIMPPWQGGGNMIRNVTFEETTYNVPPAKFEAGTPNIADAIGLGAALDYVNRLGLPNIAKHEQELLRYATESLSRIDGLRLIGTAREKVGVLSFVLQDRPTEEIGRLLDMDGIAVRAGHHCAQPALRRFGVEATVRPSLSIYNTPEEIDLLTEAIKRIRQR